MKENRPEDKLPADSILKDPNFIQIKQELTSQVPKGIAWTKERGLSSEYIIEEKRVITETLRRFISENPKLYQSYKQKEASSLPTVAIVNDPEYIATRQEQLINYISEYEPDKNELTYEEYENVIDRLPSKIEATIQKTFLQERPEYVKKYNISTKEAASYQEPPKPSSFQRFQTSPKKRSQEEKRPERSPFEKIIRENLGKQVKRATSQTTSKIKIGTRRFVIQTTRKVASYVGKSVATAVATAGSKIGAVVGLIVFAIAWFINTIIAMVIYFIVAFFVLSISVVLILFIINSGAYVVPPGSISAPPPIIPGGGECPSIWPTEYGYITQGPYTDDLQCTCYDEDTGQPYACDGSHWQIEAIDIGFGPVPGVPVYATHDGNATVAWDECLGNYIQIDSTCNGIEFYSRYAHLAGASIGGGFVQAGQEIGLSDNTTGARRCTTGAHLHYRFGYIKSFPDNPPYMMRPYVPEDIPIGCCDSNDCGSF